MARKPIHSLVVDTGPLVKNDPPADVLRSKAEQLFLIPSVLSEIRDAATRSQVETSLLPFVTIRSPKPESVDFVAGFARRTGDFDVLSRPDIEVLALAYDLECERNGGDWRLRNLPGQKRLNGRPNSKTTTSVEDDSTSLPQSQEENVEVSSGKRDGEQLERETPQEQRLDEGLEQLHLQGSGGNEDRSQGAEFSKVESRAVSQEAAAGGDMAGGSIIAGGEVAGKSAAPEHDTGEEAQHNEDVGEDSDGWITPVNVKRHQAKDNATTTPTEAPQKMLQAAVLTSDYAMQNVALRMNLNLLAPSMTRITHVKTWVMRCHGCFKITKDTSKQFCPSCGQPTLMRASCSTDDHGNFTVHLKKNFQWNNRGNVYSVPKPVHGSANGRLPKKNAGGQNGWGRDLILAEDQKEYLSASEERRRASRKDGMDGDTLPGLISGQRSTPGPKIRVGAGRNVNSRRKHR